MQAFKVQREKDGTIILQACYLANNAWTRLCGLLGRSGLASEEALLLDPCNSIHTFFMRFSIDVIFLSKDWRIVRIVRSIPPWRHTRLHLRARRALECQAGFADKLSLQVGEKLVLAGGELHGS
jgi:uncharacterized protein